ncbi:hypothetical protein ACP70R_037103 [Stipagrostis hirtigluma subsp. patula]
MTRPKRQLPGIAKEARRMRRRTASAAGNTVAAAEAVTTAATAAAAPSGGGSGGGDLIRAFGRCRALLDELLRHEDGWVFAKPVDARALGLRDYYTVVADPMDLGTVLRRLERRRYRHPRDFAADVRLTFRNAMSYNNRGDPVYESAVELSRIFEDQWTRVLPCVPPRPPTDAERKARFRDELPRLPVDTQRAVSGFLMERGAFVQEKRGKVEVDLAKVDTETLDELEPLLAKQRDAHADLDTPMQGTLENEPSVGNLLKILFNLIVASVVLKCCKD